MESDDSGQSDEPEYSSRAPYKLSDIFQGSSQGSSQDDSLGSPTDNSTDNLEETDDYSDSSSEGQQLIIKELAELSQNVLKVAPDTAQWNRLRRTLKQTSDMLTGKLVHNKYKEISKLLPFIEGALLVLNRCIKATKVYRTTEKLLERTVNVQLSDRYTMGKKLGKTRAKLYGTIQSAESTFSDMNILLLRIVNGRATMGYMKMLSFVYELRNVRGQLDTIEANLKDAVQTCGIPGMKSEDVRRGSLATCARMIGRMSFVFSQVQEEEAEADPENIETLDEYKEEILKIDTNYKVMHNKLAAWQNKFWSNRKSSTFWLVVLSLSSLLWCVMAFLVYFEGVPAIYTFFILFLLYFLVRVEQTHKRIYHWGMGLAVLAAVFEVFGLPALNLFNVTGAAFIVVEVLAYLESSLFM